MHIAHLITHLVKFLRKLSKIEGDKNFLKRGEVDVIKFKPLIKILLILNGTITGLSLIILNIISKEYQVEAIMGALRKYAQLKFKTKTNE